MKPIQKADVAQALVGQFGLVGRSVFSLDEVVVPTVDVGDFAGKSPFEFSRRCGADCQIQPAAGAAAYSGVLVRPGVGTVLVVESLYLNNNTAAAYTTEVKLLRPADVAAITVVGTDVMADLRPRMLSTGFYPSIAATTSRWHHTTLAIGALIGRLTTAVTSLHEWPMPRGVILDGTDPAGVPVLAIQRQDLNQPIVAGVVVTEYRPTGR